MLGVSDADHFWKIEHSICQADKGSKKMSIFLITARFPSHQCFKTGNFFCIPGKLVSKRQIQRIDIVQTTEKRNTSLRINFTIPLFSK